MMEGTPSAAHSGGFKKAWSGANSMRGMIWPRSAYKIDKKRSMLHLPSGCSKSRGPVSQGLEQL